jgi:subtilisin family serine protease
MDTNDTKKEVTKVPITYKNQEWHFIYDKSFFEFNKIDKDAHVHANKTMKEYSGKGITIAVIDDNLDTAHPDIRDAIMMTYNVEDNTTVVAPLTGTSHGTAVVGILSANDGSKIKGMVQDAKIIFIAIPEILTDSAVIKAFDFAKKNGADIISCSWGTNDVSDIVREKIKDVVHQGRGGKGIAVVFASGNNSEKIGDDESAIEDVIGVGSTNKYNRKSFFSNYGETLDFVAPGGEYIGIPTLDISGSKGLSSGDYLDYNDENTFIGTSASTPIVSATIALMLEKNPNLIIFDIYNILKNSADKLDKNYGISGHSEQYGFGKINVDRAMEMVK